MRTTYIKFIILGDVNTGKSTLLKCFATDQAFGGTTATIGFEFLKKTITDQHYGQIEFVLWDTSGMEKYHITSITQTYYRGAQGVILCFDLSDHTTYDNIVSKWLPRLRSSMIGGAGTYRTILVGTKSDLERKVSTEEAENFAVVNHMHYVELSSLKDEVNLVRKPFLLLTRQLIDGGICKPVYIEQLPKKGVIILDREDIVGVGDDDGIKCCLS